VERASVGMVYFGKVGREREKSSKGGGPWNLENTTPFSFSEAKASCLFDLFLELVDLKSIQLLGSHID
jgi:hypothetical protein